MADIKYKRVVLKLSGEALAGEAGHGINPPEIRKVAEEIKEVHDLGVEIAIVVGGGNMWRGEAGAAMGMERAQADYIGMLGTVFKRRLKCARLLNLISEEKPCVTSKKAAS